MSLSFLSPQDVEGWVPEPAPWKDGAGLVAKLFTAISRAIASLTTMLSVTKGEAHTRCRNDCERFFLWGQGLSVVDGDLDEVLAHSKELHFRVLSLLLRLGTVVLQGLSQDLIPSSRVLTDQCDDLRILLDTTETMLQESEPDKSPGPYTPSEYDASECEVMEIVEETSIYLDCLLDLSSSLDNPALDIQMQGSDEPLTQVKESFTVSSEEVILYCRKIRDRFEVLPKYLVERLAEANVLRAATLRELRSRPPKHDAPINDDITESLFSTTDPQATATTKSMVLSSVFSSKVSLSGHAPLLEFDDNTSETTFASFCTAASAISLGRPRVPPMPEIQGDGFDCPLCFLRVTNVKTRKEWKKHVFDDLKPYVCTMEDCKDAILLYNQSSIWAQHEASHLSSALRSSECSFCSAIYQHEGPAYYRHVSAHLRELSLSVLPQPVDEDDGFDTDDSVAPSSTPGSERIDLKTDVEREVISQEDPVIRETNAEGYQSQPPLSQISSITSFESTIPVLPYSLAGSAPASSLTAEPGLTTDEVDLDDIIDRLLEVRRFRPGKHVQLLDSEIRYLCVKATDVFLSQPMLLELKSPLKIMGDVHGQYYDLLKLFEYGGFPPEANYLFLGNYVGHGKYSLETICLILAYKIKYPDSFLALRGNHEIAEVNRIHGFYDECKRRYDIGLWKCFVDVFNCMPLAAIIEEKIFCVHGGLSPDLSSMEQIRRIVRPTDIPDTGLICDLLFSHPEKYISRWSQDNNNDDGVSFTFGPDVVSRFLEKHDLDLIVRGNQVVEHGYEFFAIRQLITLFSAPNFKGEYENAGAIMSIDESLLCSFQILKAAEKRVKFGPRGDTNSHDPTIDSTPRPQRLGGA